MPVKLHDTHIRFPAAIWKRLKRTVKEQYLPSINAAVVQAVKEWLDERDKSKAEGRSHRDME